jgi:hypothetical protein
MKLTIASLMLLGSTEAFLPPSSSSTTLFGVRSSNNHALSSTIAEAAPTTDDDQQQQHQPTAVRAPLKYLGPYPALSLRFPNLATDSQRERNVTGVSLDFILDTAANTNTVNGQVAKELGLEIVGSPAPAGMGAGGPMEGGETYLFGDSQLDGLRLAEGEEPFTFMTDLTAAALPVASPASAGLLGLSFLQCFEGGVEFAWGQVEEDGKTITEYPSVTFYDAESAEHSIMKDEASSMANITPLPLTLLPSIIVNVNGVEMPALLDTGSPITVLNAQAAKAAGIETTMDVTSLTSGGNPFSNMANSFKMAQAASRGEVLTLASNTGQPVYLVKSKDNVSVGVESGDDSDSIIDFGDSPLYVGDLPGLAFLNGLGEDSSPAVVLGMDVLQKRSKMLFRGQQNEVYFSAK